MNNQKRLIQVKLTYRAFEELQELQKATGLTTITQLVQYSLALLKWIVQEHKEGHVIYAIPKDSEENRGEKIQLLLPLA